MAYDMLVKEVAGMNEDQVLQLLAFARFLKYGTQPATDYAASEDQSGWKRHPGLLAGQIWMADDFDETPDGFEEYM